MASLEHSRTTSWSRGTDNWYDNVWSTWDRIDRQDTISRTQCIKERTWLGHDGVIRRISFYGYIDGSVEAELDTPTEGIVRARTPEELKIFYDKITAYSELGRGDLAFAKGVLEIGNWRVFERDGQRNKAAILDMLYSFARKKS